MNYYEKIGNKQVKIPKYITEPKKIGTAINRASIWLKGLADKNGIYENFGQSIVMAIKDKYIDISKYNYEMNNNRRLLQDFSDWVSTYSVNSMNVNGNRYYQFQ